jgi:hypothetical protein
MADPNDLLETASVDPNDLLQKQPQVQAGNNLKSAAIGAGVIGGGALGFLAGGKWMLDPHLQRLEHHKKVVVPFKLKHGIDIRHPVENLPSLIQEETNLVNKTNKLNALEYKNKLLQFDNEAKNTIIKDAANDFSKKYPEWRAKGWKAYGDGLKEIESILDNSHADFDASRFNEGVIQKTADELHSRGLIDEAKALRDYATSGKSTILNETTPISFTNAKQAVVNLAKEHPAAARELRANWGLHLQTDPVISQIPEVSEKLAKINADYIPFKKADTVAFNLLTPAAKKNPVSAELDTNKVTNALHDYMVGSRRANPQTTELLRSLDLGQHADNIDTLSAARSSRIAAQAAENVKKVSESVRLQTAHKEATEMASIEKELTRKVAGRKGIVKFATGVGLLGGIGRSLMRGVATGAVENELMNRTLEYDPMEAIGALNTGMFGSPEEKAAASAEALKKFQEANAI